MWPRGRARSRSGEKRLGGHWGRGGRRHTCRVTRPESEPLRPDTKARAGRACVLLNRSKCEISTKRAVLSGGGTVRTSTMQTAPFTVKDNTGGNGVEEGGLCASTLFPCWIKIIQEL